MERRVFVQGLVATGTALVAGGVEARPTSAVAAPKAVEPGAASEPAPSAPANGAPIRAIAPSDSSSHENLWPLLAPLGPGDEIGLGWRVVELTAVNAGAAILTIGSGDRLERVHLCRLDGARRGVAHSDTIDLLLMNRADGTLITDENLARALNVLALLIQSNERAGVRTPDGLMGHDARLAFFRAEQALL